MAEMHTPIGLRQRAAALLLLLLFLATLLEPASGCHWRYGEISYEVDCDTPCMVDVTITMGWGTCRFPTGDPPSFCADGDTVTLGGGATLTITNLDDASEFSTLDLTSSGWCELQPRPVVDATADEWRRYQKTVSLNLAPGVGRTDCEAKTWKLSIEDNNRENCLPNDPLAYDYITDTSGNHLNDYPCANYYTIGTCDPIVDGLTLDCNGQSERGSMQFEAVVDFCTCVDAAWLALPSVDTGGKWASPRPDLANLVYFPQSATNYYAFPAGNPSGGASGDVSCSLDTDSLIDPLTIVTAVADDARWYLPQCVYPGATLGPMSTVMTAAQLQLDTSTPDVCGITWDTDYCVVGQKFILRMKLVNSETAFTCSSSSRAYSLFDTLVEIVDGVFPSCSDDGGTLSVICDTLATCPSASFIQTVSKTGYSGSFEQLFWRDPQVTGPDTATVDQTGTGFMILGPSSGLYRNCDNNPCVADEPFPMQINTSLSLPGAPGTYTVMTEYCDLYNLCVTCGADLEFSVRATMTVRVFADAGVVGTDEGEAGIAGISVVVTYSDASTVSATTDVNGDADFDSLSETLVVTSVVVDVSGYQAVTVGASSAGVVSGTPAMFALDTAYSFSVGLVTTEIQVEGGSSPTVIVDGDTTPSEADGTQFTSGGVGTSVSSGATTVRTYTVSNLGFGTLTVSSIAVSGTNMADFAVSPTSLSIGADSSATFDVTFTPSMLGDHVATVTLTNDETSPGGVDEQSYTFAILARGVDPRIAVEVDSAPVSHMSTVTGTIASDASSPLQFTVEFTNVGDTTDLVVASVVFDMTPVPYSGFSCSGCSSAPFTLTASPPALTAGTSSVTVEFDPAPGEPGVYTAELLLDHNDATESDPFSIVFEVTVTEAQIVVYGNSMPISDGDMSPSPSDHTTFDDTETFGSVTSSRTFMIDNPGDVTLAVTDVVSSSSLFTVSSIPSSVGAGTSESFVVTFDPDTLGNIEVATITVISAAPAPGRAMYTFDVQGLSAGQRLQVAEAAAGVLADGDTVTMTTITSYSGAQTATLTISNVGTAFPLGVTSVALALASDAEFACADCGTATVERAYAAGVGGVSFDIVFTPVPGTQSVYSALVEIANDDPSGDGVFSVALAITVTEPEIEVFGNGQLIMDGDGTPDNVDHTMFPTDTLVGATSTRTYTVSNVGTEPLDVASISATGPFTVVTSLPLPTIASMATGTFTVEFQPTTIGSALGTISLSSNVADPTAVSYSFAVGGVGFDARVSVLGNGLLVRDEDTNPRFADLTRFDGQVATPIVHEFTVRNDGNWDAVISGITITDAPSYPSSVSEYLVDNLMTTLMPGEETTFELTLNPDAFRDGYYVIEVQIQTDQRSIEVGTFESVDLYTFYAAALVPPAVFDVTPHGNCWMYRPCCFHWEHNIPTHHLAEYRVVSVNYPTAIERVVGTDFSIVGNSGDICFVPHHVFTLEHEIIAVTHGLPFDNFAWPPVTSFQIEIKAED